MLIKELLTQFLSDQQARRTRKTYRDYALVIGLFADYLDSDAWYYLGGLLPRINPWASTRRPPPPSRGRQTPLEDLDRSGIEPSQSMVYPSHL